LFQANLLEQREKIQQKHDEAKTLKDGIDRRSRLVTNILRKYLSDEQFDDYEHFIRMKSTLLMDTKDTEETITFLQKQIQISLNSSSISHLENSLDHLPTNYCKSISTTA
jgi:protein Shroom